MAELYEVRSVLEDEIGIICREVYESFNQTSYSLSQLNLSRQAIDDWMRFELNTPEKRKHCLVIVHKPTASICGVCLYKSHATMVLPLPRELSPIAPRYYLFQEIRSSMAKKHKLSEAGTVYGEFAFLNELHRGRLSFFITKEVIKIFQKMNYTDIVTEAANPFLIKLFRAEGFKVLGEISAAHFELNKTRPYTRDFPMAFLRRELTRGPKL